MAYLYDVFISYSRDECVGGWVKKYFKPTLRKRLAAHLLTEPKVYLDTEDIPVGAEWPVYLKEALGSSKMLIPVWTPPFFRSRWCLAEWQTFIAREAELSLPKLRLVYPVKYSDGTCFQDALKRYQCRDLSNWGWDCDSFGSSPEFLKFVQAVDEIARELAEILDDQVFPPHNAAWPIVDLPDEPAQTPIPQPRF